MSTHALFGVAPYAAAAWLVAMAVLRYLWPRPAEPPAALGATVRTFRGHWLWRVGVGGTLAGHVLVLLLPQVMLAWNASLVRLVAFEVSGLLLGCAAAAGVLALLRSHLRDQPLLSARSLADTMLLGLLLLSIGSGLGIAVVHRWASSWSLMTLTPYVSSLITLRPDLRLVDGMPYLVRLHVLSAVAFAAVLPLSRLLDLALRPLDRMIAAATTPLRSVAQRGRAALEERGRRAARAFWWEEDEDRLG